MVVLAIGYYKRKFSCGIKFLLVYCTYILYWSDKFSKNFCLTGFLLSGTGARPFPFNQGFSLVILKKNLRPWADSLLLHNHLSLQAIKEFSTNDHPPVSSPRGTNPVDS